MWKICLAGIFSNISFFLPLTKHVAFARLRLSTPRWLLLLLPYSNSHFSSFEISPKPHNSNWDLRHCRETHYHKAYIVTDKDVHLLYVGFFEPNLTQVVPWFDVEIKHRLVSLSLDHLLDQYYVGGIIFESLIAYFATTATISCQIASRLLKPAWDRNLRRLWTSIIEKLLTACELLCRWRGCRLSSLIIIRQCGWPRASTTFFESQIFMWSYSSSSSSSTSAITLKRMPRRASFRSASHVLEIMHLDTPKCSFHSYTVKPWEKVQPTRDMPTKIDFCWKWARIWS